MLNLRQELHAEHRQFQTVAGALLWYAERRKRREGPHGTLNPDREPCPAHLALADMATHAKIAGCLRERDLADYGFDPPVTSERLEALLVFYQHDEPQHLLAERLGMTWSRFCRECRRTRNVIRRRMDAAGLLAA